MFTRRELLIAAGGIAATSVLAGVDEVGAAVYAALFEQLGGGHKDFVIRANREVASQSGLPESLAGRLREFEFPKQQLHRSSDFRTIRTHLIGDAEYLKIFSDSRSCAAAWKLFHSRYPQAKVLIELSGVGLRGDGREAVVLIHAGSGCLGGRWDALFFVRETADGAWKFKEGKNFGVS